MKEILIQKGFEKWLSTQELAPYPIMFFEIPKLIQYAYIQKWLRGVHKIEVFIDAAYISESDKMHYQYCVSTCINDIENSSYCNYGGVITERYEESLKLGINKALELL